jgi:hypothetical protein
MIVESVNIIFNVRNVEFIIIKLEMLIADKIILKKYISSACDS